MRSLAITLYLIITGCFVLATSLVDFIGLDYYTEDIKEGYIWQADLVSRLVLPALYENPKNHKSTIAHWQQQVGEAIQKIEIINTPIPSTATDLPKKPYISEIVINEYSDSVAVIVPLDHPQFNNKSIKLQFIDAYSDRYLKFDAGSTAAVYVFMGIVISVVALIIYRYMNQISLVTQAVASGDYTRKMPSSRIGSLQALANDINTMAGTIEEYGVRAPGH